MDRPTAPTIFFLALLAIGIGQACDTEPPHQPQPRKAPTANPSPVSVPASPALVFDQTPPPGADIGPPRPPIHVLETFVERDLWNWVEVNPVEDNWTRDDRIATPWDAVLDPRSVSNTVSSICWRIVQEDEAGFLESYVLPALEFREFMLAMGQTPTMESYDAYRSGLLEQLHRLHQDHASYIDVGKNRQDRLIGNRRFARAQYEYGDPEGRARVGCVTVMLSINRWVAIDLECNDNWETLDRFPLQK